LAVTGANAVDGAGAEEKIRKKWPGCPAGPIVDVEHGALLSHRTVLIEDGTVTSVVSSSGAAAKPGADILEGAGKFLMPGLWDMHTHITHTDVDFPLYIANGVLGIRNMGGVQDQVFAWQKQLKDGELFGPLAFVSGPILDGP
jgi:cytosine/adenosine deaminase-related metal-dependent hydrolase